MKHFTRPILWLALWLGCSAAFAQGSTGINGTGQNGGGGVNSVTGAGTVACTPTTGSVVCTGSGSGATSVTGTNGVTASPTTGAVGVSLSPIAGGLLGCSSGCPAVPISLTPATVQALINSPNTVDATNATYGADNTGVADSTAAVNSALATTRMVYLPNGTYKFSTVTSGHFLSIPSGGGIICENPYGTNLNFSDPSGTADLFTAATHSGNIRVINCSVQRITTSATSGADFHFTDAFNLFLVNNVQDGARDYDKVLIDCSANNPSNIHIVGHMNNALHDAVHASCGVQTTGAIASASTTLGIPIANATFTANTYLAIATAATGGQNNLTTQISGTPTLVSQSPTCTTTNSSTSVTACGTLNAAIIPGLLVVDSLGCLPAGDTIATVATTSFALTAASNGSGCGASDVMTITGTSIVVTNAAGATAGGVAGTANPQVFVAPFAIGDLYIENGTDQRNYLENSANAGVDLVGNMNGVFIRGDTIFHNAYGILQNCQGLGSVSGCGGSFTITDDDIDSNTTEGESYVGLNTAKRSLMHVFSSPLGMTCIGCASVEGSGNSYVSIAGQNETLEAVSGWKEEAQYNGGTGGALVENFGTAVSANISLDIQAINGSGFPLNLGGNSSFPTTRPNARISTGTGYSGCATGTNYSSLGTLICNGQVIVGAAAIANTGDLGTFEGNSTGVVSQTIENTNNSSTSTTVLYLGNGASSQSTQLIVDSGAAANPNETILSSTGLFHLNVGGANYLSALGGILGTPFALLSSGTAFTTTVCTNGSLVGGATAGEYLITGVSNNCVIALPAVTHAYSCSVSDTTTLADTQTMAASTTNSATFAGTTVTGDKIKFSCTAGAY